MILDPTSTEDPDHKQHNPRTQEETALGQPISRYLIFVIKPQGYGTPVNRITKYLVSRVDFDSVTSLRWRQGVLHRRPVIILA